MSTTTIQQNILYGIGEAANIANATSLTHALRWANAAYRKIKQKHIFKHLETRSIFKTVLGQQTYQAPSDFMGFLTLKDETNDNVLDQKTPEEMARVVSTTEVTDESFTSSLDVAVSLDNEGIVQYSEKVTTTAGTTTYTKDTDYTMDYAAGTITVLSTGSMADETEYYIDYLYYAQGKPTQFCIEYDATNKKYVFMLDPIPDAVYVASIVYPANPSALSGSVDPIWDLLEFAIERGGIYYGSLELTDDMYLRNDLRGEFTDAMNDLIRMDQDLVPKHDRIKVVMRKSDY